ncbi:hepatic and glial cell adhesion molecule [Amia ocellicauda]|uniref:hepatic and glial cell adhesion molecule n=1 Tax=Amia ocellicauda TaxID=2972642 RepID=UPI00346409D4
MSTSPLLLLIIFTGGVVWAGRQVSEDARVHGVIRESVLLPAGYPLGSGWSLRWSVRQGNSTQVWLVHNGNLSDRYSHRAQLLEDDGSLRLNNLTLADQGLYIVIATDTQGTQRRKEIYLTVSEPVMVSWLAVSPQPPISGRPLTLVCALTGGVQPKLTWLKDQVLVSRSANLSVAALEPSDCGLYTCLAEDSYSSHNSSYRLTVPECENSLILPLVLLLVSVILPIFLAILVKLYCCGKQQNNTPVHKREEERGVMDTPSLACEGSTDVVYTELDFPFRRTTLPIARPSVDLHAIYSQCRL